MSSLQERLYLHRRVVALEALAARLEQRAAAMAPPDAAFLLGRATKHRVRADRLRAYVRSTGRGPGVAIDPRGGVRVELREAGGG